MFKYQSSGILVRPVKPYGMHTSLQASIDREGTRWKTRVFSMLAVVRCVPALSTSMVV
jgi:hypothetical protein